MVITLIGLLEDFLYLFVILSRDGLERPTLDAKQHDNNNPRQKRIVCMFLLTPLHVYNLWSLALSTERLQGVHKDTRLSTCNQKLARHPAHNICLLSAL